MKSHSLAQKVRDFFLVILTDPRGKSNAQIVRDYVKYLITNPVIAEQYFYKFLYRSDVDNVLDYIVTRDIQRKSWVLNHPDYVSIMDNKMLFGLFYAQCNLPVAQTLAYNINTLFFKDDQIIPVNTVGEFSAFLTALLKEESCSEGLFIKKNEGSGGGKNIFKITNDMLLNGQGKLADLHRRITASSFMFQESICQHEHMNKLNACCVNTLRFDTFTNRQHESRVFSCFLRFGLKTAFVDNVSSGGAYIGVNMETGTLFAEALTDFTHGKGKTYLVHPDNNLTFEGFQVPYFQEAKQLVIEAANRLPQLRVIGWDVAIRPDGPVLLEGNELPGIVFSEISQKGFRNNKVFIELYEELTGKHA